MTLTRGCADRVVNIYFEYQRQQGISTTPPPSPVRDPSRPAASAPTKSARVNTRMVMLTQTYTNLSNIGFGIPW
ncbi:hypothetical protein ACQ86N_41670 [Puia sp. P3]|uniref:hypothetical protein n=1 Tax=Puia sp. P3 TaxID=3423952 RepID=UPI003D6651D1